MATSRPSRAEGGSPQEMAAALAQRHQRCLVIFAMRQLGDAELAEEAAQEALRRVCDALEEGRVRDLQALPAFLYQTLRNVCLQEAARLGRERRALERFVTEPQPPNAEIEPLTALVRDERRATVRRALDRLASKDRNLLEGLYLHDMDPREVARRLALTPGALRVRKHRALKRLAAALEGESKGETETA